MSPPLYINIYSYLPLGGRARKGLIPPPPPVTRHSPYTPCSLIFLHIPPYVHPYTSIYLHIPHIPIYPPPSVVRQCFCEKHMNRRILIKFLNLLPSWENSKTKNLPWRWLGGPAMNKSPMRTYIFVNMGANMGNKKGHS